MQAFAILRLACSGDPCLPTCNASLPVHMATSACREMATWYPTLWTWLAALMPWTAQLLPRCLLLLLLCASPALVPSHAHSLHALAPFQSTVVLRDLCLCCAGERLESGNSQPPAPKILRQLQVAAIRPGLGHRVKVGPAEKPALAPWEWHTTLLPSPPLCSVAVQRFECFMAVPER